MTHLRSLDTRARVPSPSSCAVTLSYSLMPYFFFFLIKSSRHCSLGYDSHGLEDWKASRGHLAFITFLPGGQPSPMCPLSERELASFQKNLFPF